jgi:hypothetical protein
LSTSMHEVSQATSFGCLSRRMGMPHSLCID